MRSLVQGALGAMMLLVPSVSFAQEPAHDHDTVSRPIWGAAGASFSYGRPVGDFLRYVREGYGFDAFMRVKLEPSGVLSLKLDGGLVVYGNETFRVPLSETVGGRILVDVTTSNNIVWLGLGPQVTIPMGFIRPYGNASIGFSYFFTESHVEGSDDAFEFARTTNFSDAAFRYGFGWGVLFPFQAGTSEWAIDLGAIYHGNGQMRYLREGSIIDLPDGDILLRPIRSDANLLTYRIGFSVSLR